MPWPARELVGPVCLTKVCCRTHSPNTNKHGAGGRAYTHALVGPRGQRRFRQSTLHQTRRVLGNRLTNGSWATQQIRARGGLLPQWPRRVRPLPPQHGLCHTPRLQDSDAVAAHCISVCSAELLRDAPSKTLPESALPVRRAHACRNEKVGLCAMETQLDKTANISRLAASMRWTCTNVAQTDSSRQGAFVRRLPLAA